MWLNGAVTISASFPYIPISETDIGLGDPDATGASFLLPVEVTITSLTLKFTAAMPGGSSLTYRFNVDGVDSNEIIATATAGMTTLIATGRLTVPQDARLCLHVTSFAGSPSSLSTYGVAYEVAAEDGFVRPFIRDSGVNPAGIMLFGSDSDTIALNGSESFIRQPITITEATIANQITAGAGNGQTLRFFSNNASSLTTQYGTTVTQDNVASVRGTVNGAIPASPAAPINAQNGYQAVRANLGSPTFERHMFSFAYQNDETPELAYFGAGNPYINEVIGATIEYVGFNQTSPNTSSTNGQTVIPIPGTFRDIRINYTTSAGTTYTLDLMVNGSPAATFTLDPAPTRVNLDDLTTEVPVVIGDVVNWRITRTVGTGTAFIMSLCMGFVGTVE